MFVPRDWDVKQQEDFNINIKPLLTDRVEAIPADNAQGLIFGWNIKSKTE